MIQFPQTSLSTSASDFCSPESQLAAALVSARAHSQLLLLLITFLEAEDLMESIDVDPRATFPLCCSVN